MPSKTSRYVAAVAILVAGFCTTVMNWRFSFQLATNQFDAHVWAAFSVALDVCKWIMLPFAALAWRAHKLRSLAAAAIWLVATCYSFAAALGFAALNREITTVDRRSQAEIHTTLQVMKQSPRWQSSAACADATTKSSKEFCIAYRTMESQLKALPQQEDPQSALVARLTGLTEEQARLALALSLAIACELVSALGLFAILSAYAMPRLTPDLRHKHAQQPEIDSVQGAASSNLVAPRWRSRQN